MNFLQEIGAKWAIVFAFDANSKVKLHVLSESGDNVELINIIAMANEILDRFTGLFPPSTITPPKDS